MTQKNHKTYTQNNQGRHVHSEQPRQVHSENGVADQSFQKFVEMMQTTPTMNAHFNVEKCFLLDFGP